MTPRTAEEPEDIRRLPFRDDVPEKIEYKSLASPRVWPEEEDAVERPDGKQAADHAQWEVHATLHALVKAAKCVGTASFDASCMASSTANDHRILRGKYQNAIIRIFSADAKM